jgi:hypothetical protein
MASSKRKGVGDVGLTRNNSARVDQRQDELQNRRGDEIEILSVDLGGVHARPRACDATTVCLCLSAAHDLHAVREEILRCSRIGAELIEKRMR